MVGETEEEETSKMRQRQESKMKREKGRRIKVCCKEREQRKKGKVEKGKSNQIESDVNRERVELSVGHEGDTPGTSEGIERCTDGTDAMHFSHSRLFTTVSRPSTGK